MYYIKLQTTNRNGIFIVNYELENLNNAAAVKTEVISMIKTFVAGDQPVRVEDDGYEVTVSCILTDGSMYMEAANQMKQIEDMLKENYN